MKIKLLYLILIFFSLASFAQENTKNDTKISIKPNNNLESKFINDVFGNNIVVDSQHYKNIIELLKNRVFFSNLERNLNEKYTKLSEIKLFNKYNNSLTRDENFDPSTFNVLKYDLVFFSAYPKIYRIDNSDWIIIIQPSDK